MEPLKNYYNIVLVKNLSEAVFDKHPKFNKQNFVKDVFSDGWDMLELKERMRHIVICLNKNLNLEYTKAIVILKEIAPLFNGFAAMLFPDYVENYGLKNYSVSIKALELFTQFSSSEFAIRQFIIKCPEKTMKQMVKWSGHKNHHVRRLSSEGCRPRLPWAVALTEFKKDPSQILPILENLMNDDSEYVRKSVANNINDISKDNSEIVLDFTKKWIGKNANVDWILKHGNRTLLKKGNSESLKLFGTPPNIKANISSFLIHNSKIKIGDNNTFSFDISYDEAKMQKVRLEYEIEFTKSNGNASKKIFKISEGTFKPGEVRKITKKYKFRDYSTRKHFPGIHNISLILNGKIKARDSFYIV